MYLIEQYWPDDHARNLNDLYIWFNEKKEKRDGKLVVGDRVLIYEVGNHPDKKLKGSKTLFASGTLTDERFHIPKAEQMAGGKRWIFKRKILTDFAVPPIKGIPLGKLKQILGLKSWPQQGFKIEERHFNQLENELSKLQAAHNVAVVTGSPERIFTDRPYIEKEAGTVAAAKNVIDVSDWALRTEMASNSHKVILNRLSIFLKNNGFKITENRQVDLFGVREGVEWIFEVKSTNDGNMLSQVRHGVSQLYEYRYLQKKGSLKVRLCLVLQSPPVGELEWVTSYLRNDREIEVCWPVPDGFGTVGNDKLKFL